MSPTREDGQERYSVPGLRRGLLLLRCFTREHPEAGLSDLARELDLPRTTVFRLAQTLESMGFLKRVVGSKLYRLGPSVLGIGFEFLASLELPEIARPALEALRDGTGASSHLAIAHGSEIVYLSRYAGRSALASNIRVGSRLAAHASSMGRVLLADLAEDELDRLYRNQPLEPYTDQTPTTLDALRALLDDDRRRGYVVSRSFYERGVASIAAPVRDGTRKAVAAVSITAVEQAIEEEALDGVLKDQVCEAAQAISASLGYSMAVASHRAAEAAVSTYVP